MTLSSLSCFKASKTLSGIETACCGKWHGYFGASKPLKPFQGLKQDIAEYSKKTGNSGFKASKTLSGIETLNQAIAAREVKGFKASKTLSGIETYFVTDMGKRTVGFKASKTLSGIETFWHSWRFLWSSRCKLQSL